MKRRINATITAILIKYFTPIINEIVLNKIRIWGDESRLKIHPTAAMVNTLFNTSSGSIEIGEYTFTGHNVAILTGTHRYTSLLENRISDIPTSGRDIVIGKGVWLGSNATILGPCVIEDHAVVAAGSVVLPHTKIDAFTIYAGVPARCVKKIEPIQQSVDTKN